MSWNAYTDNLIATGKLDKAGIYGLDGSEWATSNLKLAASEAQELIQGFTDPSNLYSTGLHIEGKKNVCLKAEPESIYGKLDAEGIIAVKTKQAVLVAHYPAGVQAGEAAKIVEQLGEYLRGTGY
ncbi:unnamed protein product [Ambrosiozyma monospora]|uniref:Unnamed protein product n=1 Tax=Ambrosiozyma monospora TaxID=43982 RepID=A0ACB5T8D2_AMBMO|nr:unnamed protein product [Ambrosiozyma monospora]